VAREEDVVRLVAECEEALGGLNVLVNNAAAGYSAPLLEVDAQRFLDVHAVNVLGRPAHARASARGASSTTAPATS
jgi:NAD(P)-dependent dehydrogenase (short-subunit alcohol dehydrogenase family)